MRAQAGEHVSEESRQSHPALAQPAEGFLGLLRMRPQETVELPVGLAIPIKQGMLINHCQRLHRVRGMERHDPLLQVSVADIRMHGRHDVHPPFPRRAERRAGLQLPAARLERQFDRRVPLHVGDGDKQLIMAKTQVQLLLAGIAAGFPTD